jgi:metallopeptidase MepB
VASSRLTKLFLAAVALFIATTAILASIRLGGRVPSILQYVKPSPLRSPLYTQPFRPLTNSTMAPAQYKTPPQLPPKFTATKQSLIDDAKRLVCYPISWPLVLILVVVVVVAAVVLRLPCRC